MKKRITIIISLLLIVIFTGCGQSERNEPNQESINTIETIKKEQIVSFQSPVLQFILEDKVFGAYSGYINLDEVSGQFIMYIDANEEDGVDYEAYKEKIWEAVGARFNIIFNLTPFPIFPTTAGVIRAIEYNDRSNKEGYIGTILVVSQTSDFVAGNGEAYYEASSISVYENVPIINETGEAFAFDNLQIGMYVDSYYRGITLTTYPGLQETEKLVIHEDFQIPMASDSMSKVLLAEIFNNEDMTGPYPIVFNGYAKEFFKGDTRLWVHLDHGGMVFYTDNETLEDPGVFMGSLLIHYASENGISIEDKIPNVVIKASEDIAFSIEGDSITFEVTICENDTLQNTKYFIDEKGHLTKGK